MKTLPKRIGPTFPSSPSRLLVTFLLVTGCESPTHPMRSVHQALARQQAAHEGDALPLPQKTRRLTDRLARHLTREGLLAYRIPSASKQPVAVHSDTCAWTAYWAAACAWEFRVTGTADSQRRMNRALQGLDHLARVSGVPGLLARTIVPVNTPQLPASTSERRWRRGLGAHRGVHYSDYFWRSDTAKAQLSAWLLAVQLGIELTEDDNLRRDLREDLGHIAFRIFHANLDMTEFDGDRERFGDLHPAGPPISRLLLTPCLSIPGLRQLPWVPAVAPNTMVALGLARVHDQQRAGRRRYRDYARRDFDDLISRGAYRVPGTMKTGNDHLSLLAALVLLETNPNRNLRDNLQKGIVDVYDRHRHDRNPLFTLIALKAAALPRREINDRLDEALFTLRVYPMDRRLLDVDRRKSPGVKSMLLDGAISKTALPVNWLPSSSFLWKSQPVDLVGYPGADGAMVHAPLDFLVAYWLWRDMARNDSSSQILSRVLAKGGVALK